MPRRTICVRGSRWTLARRPSRKEVLHYYEHEPVLARSQSKKNLKQYTCGTQRFHPTWRGGPRASCVPPFTQGQTHRLHVRAHLIRDRVMAPLYAVTSDSQSGDCPTILQVNASLPADLSKLLVTSGAVTSTESDHRKTPFNKIEEHKFANDDPTVRRHRILTQKFFGLFYPADRLFCSHSHRPPLS